MYGLTISGCALALAGLLFYGIGGDVDAGQVTTKAKQAHVVRQEAIASTPVLATEMVRPSAEPTANVVAVAAPQPAAVVTVPTAPAAAAAAAVASLVVASAPAPTTAPMASTAEAGTEIASVDDDIRFVPTTRPSNPAAQHPPMSDEKNVDTGKPVHEWQRLTDDWFGARPWLDDHGISIQSSLTVDWSAAMVGGVKNGPESAFRDLWNTNVTVGTERLIGLKGGTLFANVQQQAGRNGAEITGNLQGISNIDADGRFQISEVWYEQVAFDDHVRVKAGKIDANTDFAHTPDADEFVSGAFGGSPTILGFPTYPDAATGAQVFVKPTEHISIGAGVFDGSTQAGHATGELGPATLFSGNGLFSIVEGQYSWTTKGGLDGVVSGGVWRHSGDFDRLDGHGTASGTAGQYLMIDHKLWRENPNEKDDAQGIGFFAKYGHADGSVSAIDNHVAVGITWTGAIPSRDDDVLGLGVTWAGLSGDAAGSHAGETLYELFYRVRVNAWFSVKPNLQYIHNAADGGEANTLVGSMRIVIDF